MQYPIIHTMEQGSDEWFAVRLGKVTASNFSKAIGKAGTTRSGYMLKLVAERLTKEREASYSNSNMEWGVEHEPAARKYYESVNDCIVKEVGFVAYDADLGVSPDGLVDEDGLIEIKCPLSSTHVKYVLGDKLPSTYKPQIQGQLWVTGRKWCDFISYDPRNLKRPYWRFRVKRDEDYIAELQVKIGMFIDQLIDMENQFDTEQF